MGTIYWIATNAPVAGLPGNAMTTIVEGSNSAEEAASEGAEQFGDPPEGWSATALTPTQARELGLLR